MTNNFCVQIMNVHDVNSIIFFYPPVNHLLKIDEKNYPARRENIWSILPKYGIIKMNYK